tara:strand:+ start:33 stop:626 length:594 start_codon:yes stop_codon:yes gene_type:complete
MSGIISDNQGRSSGLVKAAGGGIWTLIGTSEASDDATLDQTGLDSTDYDTYVVVLSSIIPATDPAEPMLRLGDSGGIDSGASDYVFHTAYINPGTSSYQGQESTGANYIKLCPEVGGHANNSEGFCAVLYIGAGRGDSTVAPLVHGTALGERGDGVIQGGHLVGQRVSVITLDRVQFLFSTGDVESGRMSVYGIKHA